MSSLPTIPEFFKDRGVFITGATGFMGKALMEKLLRSCPEIGCIYILIRPKRGKDVNQRMEEIFNSKLFDSLREKQPNFQDKVVPIVGDILHDNLGISKSDEKLVQDGVSIFFHSAATVKFDEEMKLAVEMNIVGVHRVLEFCKKMHNLEALIHVSTAYANCNVKVVEEKVYDPPLEPNKLLDAVDWMDSDILNTLTPYMVKDRPNTYTYTKAIAECLVRQESNKVPTAIFRPSIVGASWSEPCPGWVDNYNGPTGLLAAIGTGLLRIMKGNFHGTADVIPVDLACNMMIACAWHTAVQKPREIPVYNCTTGQLNRFTWGQMERGSYEYFMKNPVNTVRRIPNPRFTRSTLWHDINVFFDHIVPAYLMDFYMWLSGRRPLFVKIQTKLRKAVASLDFFTSREWVFSNDNLHLLMNSLSKEDQKTFNFHPKVIDWSEYMEHYCLGTKQFVMKEELEELPKARNALKKLQRINYVLNAIIIIIIWRLLINKVALAKSLWKLIFGWAVWLSRHLPSFSRS